ncbi:MAG TPA: AI-2E family transporter [Candidatus Coprenecus stercoripullorum]|nr:AI-2E family transporter [Candidatus Coprenecus stercoripullorum]
MNRLAKYIIIAAVVTIAAFIAWYFKTVIIYILISAVIAMIGRPLTDLLCDIRIKKVHVRLPRWLSAGITLILMICVILSLFLLLAPMIGEISAVLKNTDFNSLSAQVSEPLKRINGFIVATFPSVGEDFRIEVAAFDYIKNMATVSSFSNIVTSLTNFIADISIAVFSIVFISFFMLKESGLVTNTLASIFADRYENNIRRASASINNLLGRYFVGISIESIGVGIINSLGLIFIAGMDTELAIVVAFASGILNIIPYVGPFIGDLLGVLMGLMTYMGGGIDMPLILYLIIVLAIFLVTQFIDNYIFQPLIYSNSVKAHPLEIFIVILMAGQMGGIFGILIAIPCYTVLRVIAGEFLPSLKFVQKLTANLKTGVQERNEDAG